MRSGSIIIYIVIALVIATIAAFVAILTMPAHAGDIDSPCLTHEQARAKWPKAYLWWSGTNHCWSNVRHNRSGRGAAQPNHAAPGPHQVAPRPDTHATVAYPSLMAGVGTTSAMLQPDAMTYWPIIFDVDNPQEFTPWSQRISQ